MVQKRRRYDRQFKLSASKLVIDEGMPVRELSEELSIKDTTLRRWSKEYEELGDRAFPGNGSPKLSKDYEIVKLKKRIEELEMENDILKKFQAFLKQDLA